MDQAPQTTDAPARDPPPLLVTMERVLQTLPLAAIQAAVALGFVALTLIGTLPAVALPAALLLALAVRPLLARRSNYYHRLGFDLLALSAARSLADSLRGTSDEIVHRINMVTLHLSRGDADQAKAALRHVDPSRIDDPKLRQQYFADQALILFGLGDFDSALPILDAADTVVPPWFRHFAFGLAAAISGRLEEARVHLAEIQEGQFYDETWSMILATRASIELRLKGDVSLALELARRAQSARPCSLQAASVLAQAMFAAGTCDPQGLDLIKRRLDSNEGVLASHARAFLLFDAVRMSRTLGDLATADRYLADLRATSEGHDFLVELGAPQR